MCEYFSRIQSNFFLRNCEQNLSYPVVKDKASENISLTFVAKSSEVVNAVTLSIDVPIQKCYFVTHRPYGSSAYTPSFRKCIIFLIKLIAEVPCSYFSSSYLLNIDLFLSMNRKDTTISGSCLIK